MERSALFTIGNNHLAKHIAQQDPLQLFALLSSINIGAFDFLLNVLFLIGQIVVGISHTLYIGIMFQRFQGMLDVLFQCHYVRIEPVGQQNAQVMRRGGNAVNMLDEQQHLQQAYAQFPHIGVKVPFGLVNAEVRSRLNGVGNAVIESVERHQFADRLVFAGTQGAADGGQHGTFTHGRMTT